MSRRLTTSFAGMTMALAALASSAVAAQEVLIRNATVHTASARGTLQNADVLVQGGRIAAIGSGLSSASAQVVDAQGRPLTPALFGGMIFCVLLSIDDFVRTFFLGGYRPTLPMLIFAKVQGGMSPEINAMATLVLVVTAAVGLYAEYFTRRARTR